MANDFDDIFGVKSDEAGAFDDIFDVKPEGGFKASAKQALGATIKGAGQAAADFIPGIGTDNAVKQYGQSVIDANPTAVQGFSDIADKPWTTVKEAVGNAGGSMAGMLGVRALGQGITALSPAAGPLAPVVAGAGQAISWLGPMAIAALPSFGGIRDKQIINDPTAQESAKSKAIAALGAGTVGLIETKFGPQNWALAAMTKEGRAKLAEKFAATTLPKAIGRGALEGSAVEGAEELVQSPVEQIASGDNPLTSESLSETGFGGVMGAVGGGVLGGAMGGISRNMPSEEPAHPPPSGPIGKALQATRTTPALGARQSSQSPESLRNTAAGTEISFAQPPPLESIPQPAIEPPVQELPNAQIQATEDTPTAQPEVNAATDTLQPENTAQGQVEPSKGYKTVSGANKEIKRLGGTKETYEVKKVDDRYYPTPIQPEHQQAEPEATRTTDTIPPRNPSASPGSVRNAAGSAYAGAEVTGNLRESAGAQYQEAPVTGNLRDAGGTSGPEMVNVESAISPGNVENDKPKEISDWFYRLENVLPESDVKSILSGIESGEIYKYVPGLAQYSDEVVSVAKKRLEKLDKDWTEKVASKEAKKEVIAATKGVFGNGDNRERFGVSGKEALDKGMIISASRMGKNGRVVSDGYYASNGSDYDTKKTVTEALAQYHKNAGISAPTNPLTPKVEESGEMVGVKEPWQMSREEYAKNGGDISFSAPSGSGSHRDSVEEAYNRGEKISPKVLKDYPWLSARDAIKPYVKNLGNLSDKELAAEAKKTRNDLNDWANKTPNIINGRVNPELGGQSSFEVSGKMNAVDREIEARKTRQDVTTSAQVVHADTDINAGNVGVDMQGASSAAQEVTESVTSGASPQPSSEKTAPVQPSPPKADEQAAGVNTEYEERERKTHIVADRTKIGNDAKKANMLEAIAEARKQVPPAAPADGFENAKTIAWPKQRTSQGRKWYSLIGDYDLVSDKRGNKWQLYRHEGHVESGFEEKIGEAYDDLNSAKSFAEQYLLGRAKPEGLPHIFKNAGKTYQFEVPNSAYHLDNFEKKVRGAGGIKYSQAAAYFAPETEAFDIINASDTIPPDGRRTDLTPGQRRVVAALEQSGGIDTSLFNPLGLEVNNEQIEIARDLEKVIGDERKVTPWRLPDTLAKKHRSGRVHMGGVPRSDFESAERLAEIFGRKIVWANLGDVFSTNGLIVPNNKLSEYIFIDPRTGIAPHTVYGHELAHHLETSHPQQYQDLYDIVSPLLKDVDKYRDKISFTGNDINLRREIIADLLGDSFDNPSFWNEVAAQSPRKFRKIAAKIRAWIDSLIAKFSARGFGSEQYVTDLKATRKALAKLMVQTMSEKGRAELASGKAGVNSFAQDAKMSLSSAMRKIQNMAAFKKWFDGSKIVDEDGAPLVLYHATRADFNHFEQVPGSDIGFHFGSSPQANGRIESTRGLNHVAGKGKASEYGERLIPVFLAIKNPLRVEDPGYFGVAELLPQLESKGIDLDYVTTPQRLITALKYAGYDGFVYKNENNDEGEGDSYVAFDPTQIKSIFNQTWNPTNPDILASFAGPQAKQADTSALSRAKAMQKSGEARRKIWRDTGWYEIIPGKGQWSYEIDDSLSSVKMKDGYLEDVLTHPKLYADYPQLAKVRVRFEDMGATKRGSFDENKRIVRINSSLPSKEQRSTLTHESQHIIQTEEGFAKGSNPFDKSLPTDTELAERINKRYREQEEKIKQSAEYKKFIDNFVKDFKGERYVASKRTGVKYDKAMNEAEFAAYGEFFLELDEKRALDVIKLLDNASGYTGDRVTSYLTQTGEAESRLVQARLDLTPAQRKAIPPWVTLRRMLEKEGLLKPGQKVEDVLVSGVDKNGQNDTMMSMSRREIADKTKSFRAMGAEVIDGKIILYRGANVSKSVIKKLRYGDFLSATESGKDATGNEGAGGYGKNVVRFELPISDVEISNGEFQYKGESSSLKGGSKYPREIYKAYNDVYGSNYTAQEIDAQDNVRSVASQGLRDGRDEFDKLVAKHNRTSPNIMEDAGDIRYSKSYTASATPNSEEAYAQNRAYAVNRKAEAIRSVKSVGRQVVAGVDKFLGAVSTRLGNINPKLRAKVRELDFAIGTGHSKDVKAVQGLLNKAKKMSRGDFADWDLARKNSDADKINELVAKYRMENEYAAYRETLKRIRDESIAVGRDVGFIEDYSPRIIKDSRGFLDAIGKGPERANISDALKKRAKEMGITVADMTPEMQADIVANLILGGGTGLYAPSNTKERKIKSIPPELNRYYMGSDAALVSYLHSMRKDIEARRFFGRMPENVSEAKKALHQAQAKLREIQASENPDEQRMQDIRDNIDSYQAILDRYKTQSDYNDNIATYIIDLLKTGEIDGSQEQEVTNILKARFHEAGTRGLVQAYKNLSYIDTMGSFTSAITQIGDFAWTAYAYGLPSAIKHAYKSVAKQSRITKEDVGIERIAQEFADAGTLSNVVNKVFKAVQLERMDAIGKESLLNAALEKYEKRAVSEPDKLRAEIDHIFEEETDSVIIDLQNKAITDNVKLLVYSRLLDFQPAALSEMSEQYLKAGNGRLFYMLKSYTLKQFDVYRNEAYNKIKTGERNQVIEGIRNLAYLSMMLVLANAGADELKDLLLSRETSLEDRTVDNVLRLFGVSKFVTWKARTEGVGSAIAKQILPPFKFIDSAGRDIMSAGDGKGLKSLDSIPIVGKLAYWHMGRGAKSNEELWNGRLAKERSKLRDIKERVEADRTLLPKYRADLMRLKRIDRLQGQLNKRRKIVNRLKNLEKTTGRDYSKRIDDIEKRRTAMIQAFLS